MVIPTVLPVMVTSHCAPSDDDCPTVLPVMVTSHYALGCSGEENRRNSLVSDEKGLWFSSVSWPISKLQSHCLMIQQGPALAQVCVSISVPD